MIMYADLARRLKAEQEAYERRNPKPKQPSPFPDYGRIGERILLYPPKRKSK